MEIELQDYFVANKGTKRLVKMNILFYTLIMAVVLLGSKSEDDPFNLFWKLQTGLDLRAADGPSREKVTKDVLPGPTGTGTPTTVTEDDDIEKPTEKPSSKPSGEVGKFDPGEQTYNVHYPSLQNIRASKVVLINGYKLGTSMMALATLGALARPKYPQMDLLSGDFYTNVYRWALRALSMIPDWLSSSGSIYPDSQKVWRKRFYYMESEVPQWLRSILFFVKDWDIEEDLKKRYKLYAQPSFDKHLRYPSKVLSTNFRSFRQTAETVENLDDSEAETPTPRRVDWPSPNITVSNKTTHF